MELHLDIYLTVLAGTIPVVNIYQSLDKSVTGPSGTALCVADYSQMGTMCSSGFLLQNGAHRETNPDWLARSVFAAVALTGASITAFLPHGQLKMQSLQNRNPSVIQSSRQKQL